MEGSIMNTEFTENIEPHEDESIEFEYLYRMNLGLSASAIKHIRRLLSVWGMLADLSFSDLVLCIQRGSHLAIVGQVRPGTAATMIGYDLVGTEIKMSDFPVASESMMSRSIVSEVDDNFFLDSLFSLGWGIELSCLISPNLLSRLWYSSMASNKCCLRKSGHSTGVNTSSV